MSRIPAPHKEDWQNALQDHLDQIARLANAYNQAVAAALRTSTDPSVLAHNKDVTDSSNRLRALAALKTIHYGGSDYQFDPLDIAFNESGYYLTGVQATGGYTISGYMSSASSSSQVPPL